VQGCRGDQRGSVDSYGDRPRDLVPNRLDGHSASGCEMDPSWMRICLYAPRRQNISQSLQQLTASDLIPYKTSAMYRNKIDQRTVPFREYALVSLLRVRLQGRRNASGTGSAKFALVGLNRLLKGENCGVAIYFGQ
jgi:hypothetical protein